MFLCWGTLFLLSLCPVSQCHLPIWCMTMVLCAPSSWSKASIDSALMLSLLPLASLVELLMPCEPGIRSNNPHQKCDQRTKEVFVCQNRLDHDMCCLTLILLFHVRFMLDTFRLPKMTDYWLTNWFRISESILHIPAPKPRSLIKKIDNSMLNIWLWKLFFLSLETLLMPHNA